MRSFHAASWSFALLAATVALLPATHRAPFAQAATGGGSMLDNVNISAILDSFSVNYDKRVRPNYGAICEYNNKDLAVGVHYINCIQVTCHSDGSITGLPCPLYRCAEGKEIGYRETDLSKPYPECCEGPICAD